jgi:hypothetical protein
MGLVQTMVEAGFPYVTFIIMSGDEETLGLVADQVIPNLTVA